MTLFQIIFLSMVQGLTEFLPISSSAHLILVNRWLGYADEGLLFDVAAHCGSLVAVVLYFRHDLLCMVANRPVCDLDQLPGHRLGAWLVLATIPIAIAGFTCADLIEGYLRSTLVIGWSTLIFGLILGIADRYARGRNRNLTLPITVSIGLSQVLALIPGASRSGVTITTGLFCGLTPGKAARLSFLLAIPAVGAASAFGIAKIIEQSAHVPVTDFALAALVSGVAAYACIALFLKIITRIGMMPFVWYRLILGSILLLVGYSAS